MARLGFVVLGVLLTVLMVSDAMATVTRTNTEIGLGSYEVPFYEGADYRGDVKSPTEFFGFELGAHPVGYAETMAYANYLAKNFPTVALKKYAETYEGRDLVYLIVSSRENMENISVIQENIGLLADPRRLDGDKQAEAIIEDNPAVAWLAYSIHGDELSSTDAALQLLYHLVAGEDELTKKIRDEVVVCIDPLQNPDGRERWIKQIQQFNGVVPNDDVQAVQHRGVWPYGRGNHYLFDLNRDWFTLVHPASRGKIKALLEWHPQYFTDSHEMGPLSTYLFSPPREPFNPFMIPQIHKWWKTFSEDQAAAFDKFGWSYYTREWNEEFYPGYGSSWSIYAGAIGLLYEQAGVDGSVVRRRDGTIMTFRETVHHQFTSSIANIGTVANNRKALLEDFYNEKKLAVGISGKSKKKAAKGGAFVFPPSDNRSRLDRFVKTLRAQNIEVSVATEPFKLRRAEASIDGAVKDIDLPAGTYLVPLAQPLRPLVEVILSFDIRMPTRVLELERKELLKHNRSKLYEITAWSMSLGYNLECYFSDELPSVDTGEPSFEERGGIVGDGAGFGYVVDSSDDRFVTLLSRLFRVDCRMWSAKKPFEVGGREFKRGSVLLKNTANPDLDPDELDRLGRELGIDIVGVNTALATSGADLGGGEFALLERPRIGLVAGSGVSTSGYGALWHLLDAQLEYPTSTLDISALGHADLRKYNVIVIPSSWWGADVYSRMLGKAGVKKLKKWIDEGGTLVAVGAAAAFAADTSVALTSVRQKRQVLKKYEDYERVLELARLAESPVVDSLDLWEANPPAEKDDEKKMPKPDFETFKQADELARRFRPHGAILAVDLDETHWLSFGERSPVPVLAQTSYTYLTKTNVQVAGKFAAQDRIRLSGVLWPEARERWSGTAFVTREHRGSGQVILFADEPNFRAYFHGGERLLLNAIFLGPGFGTSPVFY